MGRVEMLSHPLAKKALNALHERRWLILAGAVLLVLALTVSWLVGAATRPLRRTSQRFELGAYGYPNVALSVSYPLSLSPQSDAAIETRVSVSALALTPDATAPLDLVLSLPDEAVTFVDAGGVHTSGRLTVTPGYPDPLPYDLYLQHGNTQLRGGLLRAHRVTVVPTIRRADQAIAIDELAFRLRLTSLLEQAARRLSKTLITDAAPYLLVAAILAAGAWVAYHLTRRRRLRHQQLLAVTYGRLREQIKLQRWADARSLIERLRLESAHYRDIDQLDVVVSAAETGSWRREQLYKSGIDAYRQRDWPAAVQSFAAIEQETPYYRDVRFLSRSAALYADLGSRDRSRRIGAARDLGEVADLVDMQPLIMALGDPSAQVAEAAQDALRKIGVGAADDLLAGLVNGRTAVRQGCFKLLEKLGQAAREPLLGALHSSDPAMTRQAAQLLVSLGARKELAEALLHVSDAHLPGLVAALQSEGSAGVGPLIETLLQAPPTRQPVLVGALAALKATAEVDRRLEEAIRSSRSPEDRALLEQALSTPAGPFEAPATLALPAAEPRPTTPQPAAPARRRFLRRARVERLVAASGGQPQPQQPGEHQG